MFPELHSAYLKETRESINSKKWGHLFAPIFQINKKMKKIILILCILTFFVSNIFPQVSYGFSNCAYANRATMNLNTPTTTGCKIAYTVDSGFVFRWDVPTLSWIRQQDFITSPDWNTNGNSNPASNIFGTLTNDDINYFVNNSQWGKSYAADSSFSIGYFAGPPAESDLYIKGTGIRPALQINMSDTSTAAGGFYLREGANRYIRAITDSANRVIEMGSNQIAGQDIPVRIFGKLLDNNGNAGTSGQVPKSDGANGWTWQDESGGGGGSEWTDLGTVLHPTELGDSVAIGTASPASKLHVEGSNNTELITINSTIQSDIGIDFLNEGTRKAIIFYDGDNTDQFSIRTDTVSDINLITDFGGLTHFALTAKGTNGFVGINQQLPQRRLHVADTSSIILPLGTTAQRDASPLEGEFRINTDSLKAEWYVGGQWRQPGSGSGSGSDYFEFNVMDYGAIKDDGLNDDVAFQNAFDAFVTAGAHSFGVAPGGGVFNIRNLDFSVGDTTLRVLNGNGAVLKMDSQTVQKANILFDGSRNITFVNWTIIGGDLSAYSYNQNDAFFYLNQTMNVKFVNCVFVRPYSHVIVAEDHVLTTGTEKRGYTITDCYFDDHLANIESANNSFSYILDLEGSEYNQINNCYFIAGQSAVRVLGGGNNTYDNWTVMDMDNKFFDADSMFYQAIFFADTVSVGNNGKFQFSNMKWNHNNDVANIIIRNKKNNDPDVVSKFNNCDFLVNG